MTDSEAEPAEPAPRLTAEAMRQQSQRDAVAFQAVLVVLGFLAVGIGMLAYGYVLKGVPWLLVSLGSVIVMLPAQAGGKGARQLRLAHFSACAVALGWAVVAVTAYHAPRYSAAAAVIGLWIVFSRKANTYLHWREWSVAYWRLSFIAVALAGISGEFSWPWQALALAATAGLSAAAAASIRMDQRRWRQWKGSPPAAVLARLAARHTLSNAIGCGLLGAFGVFLLVVSIIYRQYDLIVAGVTCMVFGLPLPAFVVILALRQRQAERWTPEQAARERARQETRRATARLRAVKREERRAWRRQAIADAVATAHGGVRPWLLRLLTPEACRRLVGPATLGLCAAELTLFLLYHAVRGGITWGDVLWDCAGTWITAILTVLLLRWLLPRLEPLLRWSLWRTGRLSSRARVALAHAAVLLAGLLVVLAGPAPVRHGVAAALTALLPPVLAAGLGGWACLVLFRRVRATRRRLIRRLADALVSLVTFAVILLLFRPTLAVAQVAAAALFPVGVWLGVRGWRAMDKAGNPVVRSAADIVVALLLGLTFVLCLVGLANLLRLPPAEIAVLRAVLGKAGAIVDLPWWAWAGACVLLVGADLAFLRWPGRLDKAARWFTRARLVPAFEMVRRVSSGVHIGLLTIALIGLAAPAATESALRTQLSQQYTQTLAATFEARGELAAYQEIAREFGAARLPDTASLDRIVAQIDDTSRPAGGSVDATDVELDLARRVGELQATTIAGQAPALERAAATATERSGIAAAPGSAGQEKEHVDQLSSAEEAERALERQVEQAADLATGAVAHALSLAPLSQLLGDTEVTEIVREYLSGLIENSPLKDVFAGWAQRITGGSRPPQAAALVVPDAQQLENAAMGELPASSPDYPFAVVEAENPANPPAAVTVQVVNEVRYAEEGTGPCADCRTGPSEDEPTEDPQDHDEEPPARP